VLVEVEVLVEVPVEVLVEELLLLPDDDESSSVAGPTTAGFLSPAIAELASEVNIIEQNNTRLIAIFSIR
jgi:hypothetical protein